MEATYTGETLIFMYQVFDALNGCAKDEKGHPLRFPITKDSYHIPFLKEAKNKLHRMAFVNKKTHKHERQVPTLKNVKLTIDSVDMIWREVQKLGFTCLNQRALSQDALENLFSRFRAHCERNNNPTRSQFQSIFRSLQITGLTCNRSVGSNWGLFRHSFALF